MGEILGTTYAGLVNNSCDYRVAHAEGMLEKQMIDFNNDAVKFRRFCFIFAQ